ncbi:uncharacterized protein LOC122853765 [Aphidius gifuensis]|uniref:uncharacterized protein LOC122853765 n=1 Tax=Aphidius gifuensis TaxID=684658 RepID=UPI001CDC02E6|nr:uncharacterized protein LOC122853765 [Aphidius gifuensis]
MLFSVESSLKTIEPKLGNNQIVILSTMSEFTAKRKLKSDNIFSKKYKGTSEISTLSSNENDNNKIYNQHQGHSDAKNMIIDLVNDDCLAQIFMYVPVCERPKIALVCQNWKRALDYSWGNVKKLELTHWEYDENPTCLKKYPTPDGELSFLKSLLYKCGRFLTLIDLSAYGYSDIVPVINEYCPNLVKLRLRFIYDDNQLLKHNAFLRLSKLKVLTVIFHPMKDYSNLFQLIIALEFLADTLTDLIIHNWKDDKISINEKIQDLPDDTISVIRRLKALK